MILIHIAIYMAILIPLFILHSYEKEFLSTISKKEHFLRILYPVTLFLSDHFRSKNFEKVEKRKEALRSIHVDMDVNQTHRLFMAKRLALVLFIIVLFNTVSLFSLSCSETINELVGGKYILRPTYGEHNKAVDLNIIMEKGDEYIEKDISLAIEPKVYTAEQFTKDLENAKTYLDKVVLGKNTSFEQVSLPVILVSHIPNTGISVEWDLGEEKLINEDGTLNNQEVSEQDGQITTITAILSAADEMYDYSITMNILPYIYSEEELLDSEIQQALQQENEETKEEENLELPEQIGDKKVYYEEPASGSNTPTFLILGGVIAIIIGLAAEQEITKQLAQRNLEVMMDYPEIINKFTLLLGAGMTMKKAWGRIVTEYETKRADNQISKRYAYEEMKITWREIENGVSETKAYEQFGRRLKMLPYVKFTSLLAQNVKKGLQGINNMLEIESIQAFEQRKELAKQLGEQASTKLLVPMFLMFGIVLVIIMVPAFSSM